jgi:hypothetical protein
MSDWRIKLYRGQYAAVRSVNGQTQRTSLRTADLQEAKRRLKDWTAKPAGETVGELVNSYLDDKDKTAIRSEDLRGAWKQARDTFEHLRPDQITRDLCRSYAAIRFEAGRKPNTVRKELEVVRAALNFHKRGDRAVFELPPPPPPKERFSASFTPPGRANTSSSGEVIRCCQSRRGSKPLAPAPGSTT